MEQRITPIDGEVNFVPSTKRGFMLVTVLVITAVGLLFGAGALLLFRYQCQMRIDRQHELEKVYAVRSALNFIRPYRREVPPEGMSFRYHTGSDRNLGLFVDPVDDVFPVLTNKSHFVMDRGDFELLSPNSTGWYAPDWGRDYDCECGAIGVTNLVMSNNSTYGRGLVFNDYQATNSVRWWVNIGMPGTGGWLQEDYGRRYWFLPQNYVGDEVPFTADAIRLCIIRNVTNRFDSFGNRLSVGQQHGWPLSQEGERALVFEIVPTSGVENASMSLYEYVYEGGHSRVIKHITEPNCPSKCYMGIQLAQDVASFFYIKKDKYNDVLYNPSSFGYTFSSNVLRLDKNTYDYFAAGIYTNAVDHKVHAPELRAVFEVDARSSKRSATLNDSDMDALTGFRVTPAYQYDVYIEHPNSITNRATVAQKFGTFRDGNNGYAVLTYDTHGTDHKGFRKDEKDFEESKRAKGH